MEKKTGKLIKTNRGWEVEYEEKVPQLHFLAKQTVAIPLHPDSIKKLNMSNVNLELEFEIVDEIIDLGRHGSIIVKKAKLISKQEELPNESFNMLMKGSEQESWDEVFDKMLKSPYIDLSNLNEKYTTAICSWLTQNYNPPTKK